MKNIYRNFLIVGTLMLLFIASAYAESGEVMVYGQSTYGRINVFEDGTYLGQFKSGEFLMVLNDEATTGYCAELGIPIDLNVSYNADIIPTEAVSPWCELAYILENNQATDDDSGSAIQLAIWKLVHFDRNLSTDNTDIEDAANQIISNASGICPLLCGTEDNPNDVEFEFDAQPDSNGFASVTVTLTQNDSPISSQEVTFSTTNANILNGTEFTTDENGQIVIELQAINTDEIFTLFANSDGKQLLFMFLGDGTQNLITTGESCTYEDSADFETPEEEICDEEVTVYGISTYGRINLFEHGSYLGQFIAAEFEIGVNGEFAEGYCAELGAPIDTNISYAADIYPADADSPWCELSYILANNNADDDFTGSVIQLAVWKLVHESREITTDNEAIEDTANQLISDASGKCLLLCGTDESPVNVEFAFESSDDDDNVTITLSQNGVPIENQLVTLTANNATIISETEVYTDQNGQVTVQIEVTDVEMEFSVSASTNGQQLLFMMLCDGFQNLISLAGGDTCEYQAFASFEPVEEEEECGSCIGKITEMEMQYYGEGGQVQIYEKKNKCHRNRHHNNRCHKNKCKNSDKYLVFDEYLEYGDTFSFSGEGVGKDDTLGRKIFIYVDGKRHGKRVVTSCKKKKAVKIGDTYDDFTVISAISSEGGLLCEEDGQSGELCYDGHSKPHKLFMMYTKDTCDASSNDQGSKFVCEDNRELGNTVYVYAYNNQEVLFSGFVDTENSFTLEARTKLRANTYVEIYNQCGRLLQHVVFHTSCSVPINVGDQFGSLILTGYETI